MHLFVALAILAIYVATWQEQKRWG